MNLKKSLLILAAAGALFVPVGAARGNSPGEPASEGRVSEGAVLKHSDVGAGMTDADGVERPILRGEVAAVDHESGQLILATDAGLFQLQVLPEDVQDVSIGDVIRVALIEEDRSN
jgi:hypothetical protein